MSLLIAKRICLCGKEVFNFLETGVVFTTRPIMNAPGHFLCWGSCKQGQHGHVGGNSGQDVTFTQALLPCFSPAYKDTTVRLMACGSSHTIVVTKDNDLYVWGSGHCGQLGLGDEENKPEPVKLELYALQGENPDVMGVACGSRHTMVWLINGKAFSFGNNTFAQLAYDSKIKNYRANQTRPHLLRTLANRTVVQVACGEKHTVFLYQGGQCSIVGNGTLGQTGSSDRLEAILPKPIRGIPPLKYVAAGACHSVVIDVTGEVWQWGQALACGKASEEGDVLKPERCITNHPNIVQVDGGQTHSVALSANGSVYTWGYGPDGQLGLGTSITFTSTPIKLKCPQLRTNVCRVGCGDNYTAALTGSGLLYIWGKNSHVINGEENISWISYSPVLMNTDNNPINRLACGSWHMAALTGSPSWQKEDESSDTEEEPSISSTMSTKDEDFRREVSMGIPRDSRMAMSRERTTISLADFYAPSPEPQNTGRTLSPAILHGLKKLPSISDQSNIINQHGGHNKKQSKNWHGNATSPQKGGVEPLTSLGTIQQSPRSMKTDSTPRRSLPHYVGPERTLDHHSVTESKQTYGTTPSSTFVHGRTMDFKSTFHSNRSMNSDTKITEIEYKSNQSHGASIIDLNEDTKSRSRSNESDDRGSVESLKTQRTHKSRSEVLNERLAVQSQTRRLDDKTPQSNYVHSQGPTNMAHADRRKKYSLGSPHKILNTKLKYIRDTRMGFCNINPGQEKVALSSVNMDFVYPEPAYTSQYYKGGTRSQPDYLHRDPSYFSPKGFRGKGFYRNASKQSEYSVTSPLANSITPIQDGLHSPTTRRVTNAACVAYQRSTVKEKAEQKKKLEHSRFNGVLPAATSTTYQTHSPTVRRSRALPKRVNLLAKNLIHRTNNYVGDYTPVSHTQGTTTSDRRPYLAGKNTRSPVKSITPRRGVEGTLSAVATQVT